MGSESNAPDISYLNLTMPTSSCNWSYVASILRNLSDQPSPDNVSLAVQMIEEFLVLNQFIAIPGLINAIVSNVHLHYLRDFDVSLIQRLADVIMPLNNWVIQCNIAHHYPALPEAFLKILFVAGNTADISALLWSYNQNNLPIELEWLVNALPHAHPNPAHCILKLCRSHHYNHSQEQTRYIQHLLLAYEKIDHKITNRDRQHASQLLGEWEQQEWYPKEIRSRFSQLFHVFTANQSINIQANGRTPTSEKKLYPVTFQWARGGECIKLAGSFNEWTEYIPLIRDPLSTSGNPRVILELPEGVHQFKFIVDGEWQCDLDAPLLVEPLSGYKNNYINVVGSTYESKSK